MTSPQPQYQDPCADEEVRPGTTGAQQQYGPQLQFPQPQYAPSPQFGRPPPYTPSPQFGRPPQDPPQQAYYQAGPGPQRGDQPGLGDPVARQGGVLAFGQPAIGVPGVAQVPELQVPELQVPGLQVPGPLAGFGARVISYLIDYLAPLIVLYTLLFIGVVAGSVALSAVLAVVGYLGLVGFTIWNSGYVQGTTGQSIGRRVAKTKLVKIETGQPIGFGMACARHLCHLLEFFIGFLWPLWDSKRQTFADKMVGTVVIRVEGATQDRGSN